MTDTEIPQAAAPKIYYCPTAGDIEMQPGGGFDVCCEHPELHQPLLFATEVKSMCETATALGLALGRKQALVDAEAAILAFDYDRLASVGLVADVRTVHPALAKIVRDMASQPPGAISNGLTASSRHPGTPEDTKPPQEATRKKPRCPNCNSDRYRDYGRVDLPEESDQ